MKRRMVLLLLAALLSQGCASFFGHYDYMLATRKTEPTAYYPGTVTDLGLIGAGLMAPFVAPFKKEAEGWMIVAVPFVLVDLPCSFALDTLFVPGDYFYHREQNDTYWEDAFRTGVIQQTIARRHLSDHDKKRIVSLLDADKNGAASNVVDVIFGLAVSNDLRMVEIALCAQRGLSAAQYWTIYNRPYNTGRYDNTSDIQRSLAINPSIPSDMLSALAASPDKKVRLAALQNHRLPVEIATNELARLAHSYSWDDQKVAAVHTATPPDLLVHIVNSDMDLVARSAGMDNKQLYYEFDSKYEDVYIGIRQQGYLQEAVAKNPNCPAPTLERLASSDALRVRVAASKNPSTPQAILSLLAADTNTVHKVHPNSAVERDNNEIRQQGHLQEAVASNPNCPVSALETLALSNFVPVRVAVARNPSTPQSARTLLAADKELSVRMALSVRPKAPAGDKAPR